MIYKAKHKNLKLKKRDSFLSKEQIHIYIDTYIHTYTHTYIHTYKPEYAIHF